MPTTKTLIIVLVCLTSLLLGGTPEEPSDPDANDYARISDRIIDAALANEGAWKKLEYLCDRIGSRLAGSEGLRQATLWAARTMQADGLENVRSEPVMVPTWVRGREWASILGPIRRELSMLGLGGSCGTGPAGIRAEVVVVRDFEELEQLGQDQVKGRIVVYNAPWEGYGKTVRYRSSGASRAAEFGAVAVLVRSVTPTSLQTPHTGALNYAEGIPQIPAAAITIENAELLSRLTASGEPVTVELYMEAETRAETESANVIGELVGSELPEEVVVIGGHIDSWDVGQGAHDDGGGVAVSMEVLKLLKDLDLRPRRTIRAVLFTNEENGLRGGRAYADRVKDVIEDHVAAIEMDAGAEEPVGFGLGFRGTSVSPEQRERALTAVQQIGRLLARVGTDEVQPGGGGADIGPIMRLGVPGLGLRTVGTHYFDWHHTHADTLDKVRPEDLRASLASIAVMSFILADMPGRLAP
ncbi:MAG: M20/M25/M40 family metallo-hydrolase [Acidobacteriota bacterium]|nr:MAG: M20/M25/M40 family metallo-hydrolase [Acidobacteriota bacterium]